MLLILFLISCGGEEQATTSGSSATLSSIQQNTFTPTCAKGGCHSSASSSAGLSLANGESFNELVGVPSTQLPSMSRVTAGATSQSYLVHKLEGTHTGAGGTGSRMPPSGSVTDAEVQTIKDWINAGAENN